MNQARPAKRARKDTLETRRQMVDAAEALFAEHGVDNVTLLDIARAAGQKNRNAPQYHFGDKAGLINAVLDKHSDLISQRRQAMMETLTLAERTTLAQLVQAYVLPIAEHVDGTENSLAYLLINCQLVTSGSFAGLTGERATRYPELKQLMTQIGQLMPRESRARREAKMLLIQVMVFQGLAGFYASAPTSNSRVFIETLCSGVEAVLEAP